LKSNPRNFKDGKFQNLNPTPQFTEGYTLLRVIRENLLTKWPDKIPAQVVPSIKTNLAELPKEEDVLIWFGHSSYFMQLEGKRFLIDPVFSGHASPFPGMIKAFKGSDIYTVEELPEIDYLFISHDHYDHLDCKTIIKLKSKVKIVICGLGVAAHLMKWGYSTSQIIEKNWYDSFSLDSEFTVHVLPARHFSGRGTTRNNTLWCSYLLETPSLKIYIGGDSGYDSHFAEIGNQFSDIDIAILENGQYNNAWRYIHMHPDEVLLAAKDLKAKRLFPVHSGKFSLSQHTWYEPLTRISELNKEIKIPLITPLIGEKVFLREEQQSFRQWWNEKTQ
jgi:L-ascorbate metabolism protein UlaG (beta-lactamase superfamily)